MAKRERNQLLKAKSKIPRSLKAKMSRNKQNKVRKDWEKLDTRLPKIPGNRSSWIRKMGTHCGMMTLPRR